MKPGTLHPRNPHAGRYDFPALCRSCPDLSQFLRPNPSGDQTIDFADSEAVLCLNQALLARFYKVLHWQIPTGYLCPPIPGRTDAIHYLADLLAIRHHGRIPTGPDVVVLDIGTGANCIYPIIGSQSYGWTFVGTDIDPLAIQSARAMVEANPCLTPLVKLALQKEPSSIFRGILGEGDRYDLTMCNPPFHSSMAAAQAGSQRKVRNLGRGKARSGPAPRNFGGQGGELWCPGGELGFVTRMIRESVDFAAQVGWFTSLVSKSEHLRPLQKELDRAKARQIEVIPMSQGQKRSRLIAWNF